MIEIFLKEGKKVDALVNGHYIETDQCVKDGGEGKVPEPFDLFLASIGTCAGAYIKNFCDQRKISSEGIKIKQSSDFNKEKKLIENIQLEIELPLDFPEKYKNAVCKAANLCTVKRHFADPPIISTVIK